MTSIPSEQGAALFRGELEGAAAVLKAFLDDPARLEACAKAGSLLTNAASSRKSIISCGNGGSMADAIHFAEELTGRFRGDRPALRALALSDPGHLTCVANDYGFDHVFSRGVEAHGESGGVLVALSTSGNSPNVIKAAEAAKALGMSIIALTGKDGGALGELATVELRVPTVAGFMPTADRIQEVHIKLLHSLIHYVERSLFSE